jgi:hypothetical protein
MAFSLRHLSVLNYANGFTLWHYRSPHPLQAVEMPNFFNAASDMLAPGDMIIISTIDTVAQRWITSENRTITLKTLS